MGTTHTVYRATFTPTTIEIPDRCPECDADFHEVGSLIEGNWQDCTVRSHLTEAEAPAPGRRTGKRQVGPPRTLYRLKRP